VLNGGVVAWGCRWSDHGQCAVPGAAASGVTAVAAADYQSLALKQDGSVLGWGCALTDAGVCSVPDGAKSGVIAIVAGESDNLALKADGTVIAWGCGGGNYGQCDVPPGLSGATAMAAGTDHSLAVATLPPPPPIRCVVPSVVGKPLAKAKARIVKAHCEVGKVTRKRSSLRKKGHVLAQSPKAGKTLPSGAKVRLVVGKGR
jgi:hypothetical protein